MLIKKGRKKMKISSSKLMLGIVCIVSALFLATAFFVSIGCQVEPGAGCREFFPEDVQLTYNPPGFHGTLNLTHSDNSGELIGSLNVTSAETKQDIIVGDIPLGAMPYEDFLNIKPKDIKGTCLVELQDLFGAAPGFPEIVGVGLTSFDESTDTYEARVLILNVQEKVTGSPN